MESQKVTKQDRNDTTKLSQIAIPTSCQPHTHHNPLHLATCHANNIHIQLLYPSTCMTPHRNISLVVICTVDSTLPSAHHICYIHQHIDDCSYIRAVGSSFPLVRRVIELGKPILENVRGARKARAARPLGGSGGMLPQENYGFLDHLRSFLAQSWCD